MIDIEALAVGGVIVNMLMLAFARSRTARLPPNSRADKLTPVINDLHGADNRGNLQGLGMNFNKPPLEGKNMSWLKLLEKDPIEAAKQANDWVEKFEAELGQSAKSWIPVLTGAATAAEAVTGNAELIPITQAAGTGAEQIANLAATHAALTDIATNGIQAAITAAQTGNLPDTVAQLQSLQTQATQATSAIAPVVQALQSAVSK